MSFLFKNKSVKPGAEKSQNSDPLPGFFKTEPTFNMDYPVQEREPSEHPHPHFTHPQPTFTPPSSQGMYPNHFEEKQGPVTLHLSHSGVISILFSLLLLGILFFLAGFLSGMLITEHANHAQTTTLKPENPSTDLGDDNV